MSVCGYRLKDGEVESKIFDEELPKGWHDSPVKCVEKKKAVKRDNSK